MCFFSVEKFTFFAVDFQGLVLFWPLRTVYVRITDGWKFRKIQAICAHYGAKISWLMGYLSILQWKPASIDLMRCFLFMLKIRVALLKLFSTHFLANSLRGKKYRPERRYIVHASCNLMAIDCD